MPIYLKKCLICNKDIETDNKAKAICPGECRKIANRNFTKEYMRKKRKEESVIVKKVCLICKKDFKPLKVTNKHICFDCELARANQLLKIPPRKYDMTNVDSEGIVYGTIEKRKY